MKRLGVLAGAIIIQTGMGSIYAWSAFVPSLYTDHGLPMGEAQIPFGLCIAAFTIVMVFAGRVQERRGPRFTALIGGVLFGAGFLIASVSQGRLIPLIIGIGLVTGAGIGCCYVSALSACIGWFPERRGLVTGLAVVGFGGGAIVLSNVVGAALERGIDVLTVFRGIGIIYGTVVILAALGLSHPPHHGSHRPTPVWSLHDLIRNVRFWQLFIGMAAGTFAGLMTVSNIKPLGHTGGLPENITTWAISAFALGNASGRIAWGFLSDRFEGRTIPASLLFIAAASLILIPAARLPFGFIIAACLSGLGFGACFVLYAAEVARQFGPPTVGRIYPLVFLAYGILGTTGPPVAGWIFDATESYTLPLLLAAGITVAVSALCFDLGREPIHA